MSSDWGRKDEADQAIERILEAADKAFVELGVSGVGMGEVAAYAGCSRRTLYRYFENRHELHLAYMRRTARLIQQRVHESVSAVQDPEERLAEYIVGAVREVRENPATAAWFSPGADGIVARMSRSGEVAAALTNTFAADLPDAAQGDSELGLRHRWIVRVIVSLLSDPGKSAEEERSMVERFVVPVVMSDA